MNDIPSSTAQNCWSEIGVWGDSTCPQLKIVSHCRHCEVYSAGGRRLLDRPIPEGYLEDWTAMLAETHTASSLATAAHVVFRIGEVWLALAATSLREITDPRVIRTVPHRPREILRGLVNVRGELYPCVSLHKLFGEELGTASLKTSRFLVARWSGEDWVFPVDQVQGICDVSDQQIEPIPATLSNTEVVYTRGLFRQGDKSIALIDENLLFGNLARMIA